MVVDTGLHAERWSRQRAVDYMLANTSMAPRDVAVEIDRYIAAARPVRTRLATQDLELRQRAFAQLKTRFKRPRLS
jgi:uncharacterized protein (DUF885 family)